MTYAYNPYPTCRRPVLAGNGMVATSQHLAAGIGMQVLREGGNAVDAALATAAGLTVVEPTGNGLGGDAFAMVWDGKRLHGLNGSGRAPATLDAGPLRERGHDSVPGTGWASVTVPGQLDAWDELHRRFGRVPLERLLAPAIAYAEDGFVVPPVIAAAWERAREAFSALQDPLLEGWHEQFAPGGRAPAAGERWSAPAMAATLRRIALHGPRDFYEGGLAERLAAFSRRTGGWLVGDDLARHHGEWTEPIAVRYRDHEVWEMPPNSQGVAALQALALLEPTDMAGPGDPATLHRGIEAMKLALADTHRYVCDPVFAPFRPEALLDETYLDMRRTMLADTAARPLAGEPPAGGTVYLCCADRDGMMVSLIQSNYTGFGSGIVVPGTGIALHNRASCFSLEPGHPNRLAGGRRPFHTIIPAFLSRGGEPVGPFGVMGGGMQPQGHLQVVSALLDHGLNPQAALDAPRWRVSAGALLEVEDGFAADTVAALARLGHEVRYPAPMNRFGRGQIIQRLPQGGWVGATDPRADGAVLGW